jgi:hypothetical protein
MKVLKYHIRPYIDNNGNNLHKCGGGVYIEISDFVWEGCVLKVTIQVFKYWYAQGTAFCVDAHAKEIQTSGKGS